MEYLADKIGEEYKEWTSAVGNMVLGNTIFISSPTGSGKTYFILNVLLPYLSSRGKKMLYLVNRTILKEQLEKEIQGCSYALQESIRVELYQTIEAQILKMEERPFHSEVDLGYCGMLMEIGTPQMQQNYYWQGGGKEYHTNGYEHMGHYNKYDYVICDEAHYFLMDSNFNTNTILSYRFVNDFFRKKIRIYMSATIEQIKECVKSENKMYDRVQTRWFGIYSLKSIIDRGGSYKEFEYDAKREYDHIDIGILKQRAEITEVAAMGKEKWLIFVDNREFGKKLKKDIQDNILKRQESDNGEEAYGQDKVIFIDSNYRFDIEGADEVSSITHSSRQSAKVLIATSVLDNGINLKDIELRNIIIIVDNEIEFIQMLGRKRFDNGHLKVYIFKHDKEHFERRQREIQKKQKIAFSYYKRARELIQPEWEKERTHPKNFLPYVNRIENEYIKSQHKRLLQKIMNDEAAYEDVKAVFMAYDGILCPNRLSFKNIDHLNQFYSYMISEFESYGEEAFLREQLRWLNKSDKEAEEIIFNANRSEYEKCRQIVIDTLKEYVGQEINKKQLLDIKRNIVNELLVVIKSIDENSVDKEKYINAIKKNDRPISGKMMDFLREYAEIPYVLRSAGKSNYVLEECGKGYQNDV